MRYLKIYTNPNFFGVSVAVDLRRHFVHFLQQQMQQAHRNRINIPPAISKIISLMNGMGINRCDNCLFEPFFVTTAFVMLIGCTCSARDSVSGLSQNESPDRSHSQALLMISQDRK